MSETNEIAIDVRGLKKSFGDKQILRGIDLQVYRGETLVILGGSGSGKSTLLRCIIGLERPDEGDVHVLGTDLMQAQRHELMQLRQKMGMAFQAGALFGSMTVAENVMLPLEEFTDLPAGTRRIVARIKLGLVGLEESMDKFPSELSGGMVKRAALARALALDPQVMFFDEPSAGLDPITSAELDHLMQELRKIFDVTTVVVTHELESAFSIADRIAMMHLGQFKIVADKETVRQCQDPVVRQFLDRMPRPPEQDPEPFRKFLDDLKD